MDSMILVLRSVAAIVAGYGIMSLTVIAGSVPAAWLFIPAELRTGGGDPSAGLPASYLAATLVIGVAATVLGGWLAARIAGFAPFGHAVVLAALVAAGSIAWYATMPAGSEPRLYRIAVEVIAVAGVLAGGKLRAAAAGYTRDSVDRSRHDASPETDARNEPTNT